jgi:hypothetical protein
MFKKWQQLANVDVLTEVGDHCMRKRTIDWELLYINNLVRTLCRLSKFTQIWIANVTMDENFVVEAEFMQNAFAVFGISGRLQLSLFATVDGIPIGSKGSW